jgi:hypothetical protein
MRLTPILIPGKRKRETSKAAVEARKALVSFILALIRQLSNVALEEATWATAQINASWCWTMEIPYYIKFYETAKKENFKDDETKAQNVKYWEASNWAAGESFSVLFKFKSP